MIELTPEERRRLKWQRINRAFLIADTCLGVLSLLLSFIFIPDDCSLSFFLYYSIYFTGQAIQHFLLNKMPKMDVVRYDKAIKRYLFFVSIIEVTYFFLTFMFWVKAEVHPLYCFLCLKLGMSAVVGLLLTVHFVGSLLTYIQFLYVYINRKYYLLALGGFEVEQRILQQREENLRRVALIEPYYNDYPYANEGQSDQTGKFYKFDDILEDVEGEEVCSICLTRNKEGFHPILTSCRHYFHRECIENWAKINGKCPECRSPFKEQQLEIVQEVEQSEQ